MKVTSIGSANMEMPLLRDSLSAKTGESDPLEKLRGGKIELHWYGYSSSAASTKFRLLFRKRVRGIRALEFVGPRDLRFLIGGSAVSIAIGLNGLGAKTSIATPIADDHFAKIIREEADVRGIRVLPSFGHQIDAMSIIIYGLSSGDERSIVFPYKPFYKIDEGVVKRTLQAIQEEEGVTHAVATGIRQMKELPFIAEAFQILRKKNPSIVTYFMPNAALLPRSHTQLRAKLKDVLKETSIWQMNAREAGIYLGERISFKERVKELARIGDIGFKVDDPTRATIVTRGANGAAAMIGGEYYEVPAYIATNILDTASAGDAFAVGVMLACELGCTPIELLQIGAFVAGAKIGVVGGSFGIPNREKIELYLKKLRSSSVIVRRSESTSVQG